MTITRDEMTLVGDLLAGGVEIGFRAYWRDTGRTIAADVDLASLPAQAWDAETVITWPVGGDGSAAAAGRSYHAVPTAKAYFDDLADRWLEHLDVARAE